MTRVQAWRCEGTEVPLSVGGMRGGQALPSPRLLTLPLGAGCPNSSQLSHPALRQPCPKQEVSAASAHYVVRPGTESLIPIPEPVAKPQLPEAYVSPLLSSPLISLPSAKPNHHPRIPHFLAMSGMLPVSQVPMLGFSFLLSSQSPHLRSCHPLGPEHPLALIGPALSHWGSRHTSPDTSCCPA